MSQDDKPSVVYDKAKWHYGGDFPSDLPEEQGFVHTGLFLGWIIDNNLYSQWFSEEMEKDISAFKSREITGPRVFESCDGVFIDEMLNDEGNRFTQDYFDFESGQYLQDYEELLCERLPSMYHVEDTWENYEKLKERIDYRYRKWKMVM